MTFGSYTTLDGHTGSVFGVTVSTAAPHLLASASDDETVRLWQDTEQSGAWRQTSGACVGDSAMCVSFSPDATLLAAGTADGNAHLLNVRRGLRTDATADLEASACLRDHPEEVYACEFLAGTDVTLCTASSDSLFRWNVASGALVQRCGPPPVEADTRSAAMPERWRPGYVFALRQRPGSSGSCLLAGACSDGALRVWGAESAELRPLWGRRLHASIAAGCAFSADGHSIASVSKAGEIVVVDVRQQAELARVMAPVPLHGCCTMPGGQLAVCGAGGVLLVIDPLDTDGELQVAARHQAKQPAALFCTATAGQGAPLVVGGAATVQAAAEQVSTNGAAETDPLFASGEELVNSSGVRVFLTNGAANRVQPAVQKQALVHVWQTLSN